MSKPNIGELVFFWMMFATAALLSYFVLSPYLTAIFLAAVLAVLFAPVNKALLKWFGGRKNLAAFFTVLLVVCVILLPLIFFGILMFQEVITNYNSLKDTGGASVGIDHFTEVTQQYVNRYVPSFKIHTTVSSYIEEILRFVANNLNTFFSSIVAFLIDIFIIVGAMFFLYRDGEKLYDFAVKWSPLADTHDKNIIAKLQSAVGYIVTGALFVSAIQGLTVGVGFAMFGISNPVLWGAVSVIAALIPVVGTGLITVPAGVFLIMNDHLMAGIGILIWGGLLVGLADNLIRPLLIRRGVDIHPFVILLSVLGGLVYFGPIGFLAGPITIAFFYTLLDIYPTIVRGQPLKEMEEESN